MATEIQKQQENKTAAMFLQQDNVKERFKEILGNKSSAFISSALAAINSNDALKKATPESVYMAVMMAAVVDLPINANLGFAYIIPYNSKKKDDEGRDVVITSAQFQIGYKGFIQLAQRSGQYKSISAAPVYEGQLKSTDPLKGYEFDWTSKTSDKVIGYAGYFELINGFEKSLYMTVSELQSHGAKYSKTYSYNSSKWKTDFEAMALKTVIKLLISKFGPLSVDMQMQKAVIADQAVINDADTMDVEYADATAAELPQTTEPPTQTETESDRFLKVIQACDTLDKLNKNRKSLSKYPEHQQAFMDKETELTPLAQ